jgi:hypothetical protein
MKSVAVMFVLIGLLPLVGSAGIRAAGYGAAAYKGKDPIGGGRGYTRIARKTDARFVVSTMVQLRQALAAAKPGETVYVADGSKIDATDEKPRLALPGGVTIAGNRGRNGSSGPAIFTTNLDHYLFVTGGAGARVTGLRIVGPNTEIQAAADSYKHNAQAIGVDHPDFEIDNCEVTGWTAGGVVFSAGPGKAHHCYVHHNRRGGLGYGVYVHQCFLMITANRFAENRHDIAASGRLGTSYRACYNISEGMEPFTSHAFDMHGNQDSRRPDEVVPPIAGDSIVIAYNTFRSCRPRIYIAIRGEPRQGVIVHDNLFENAFIGAVFLPPCKTATVYNNRFLVPAKRAYYSFDADGNLVNGRRVKAGEIRTLPGGQDSR